jgi:hypothetical protein
VSPEATVFRSERRQRRLPARRAGLALAIAGAALSGGCGKADLRRAAQRTESRRPPAVAAAPRPRAETVPLPLPLTSARAAHFAHLVTLTAADLPGAKPSHRGSTPGAREREAAKCGGHPGEAIGGDRSPEFQRGQGLEHESLSSSVVVLPDAGSVKRDLAYTESRAGVTCYAKVLARSLRSEQGTNSHIRLLGVHLNQLRVTVSPGAQATGIRITARVGLIGTGLTVRLFVDALSLAYGPAELDLYTTSFAQPVPVRTQQELLALLRGRARTQRL